MWSSTSILLASLVTGTLLCLLTQEVGVAYLACFTLGALITVLAVEPRGLFLTAAQIPFLFGLLTPFAALMVTGAQSPSPGDGKLSKTELIALIFPLAQFFPTLIAVTIGAVVIALIRYWKHKKTNERLARRQSAQRKRDSRSDRSNLNTAARARRAASRTPRYRDEQSGKQVTVDELLRRSQNPKRKASTSAWHEPPRRSPSPATQRPHRPQEPQRDPDTRRDAQNSNPPTPRTQRPHHPEQRPRAVPESNRTARTPRYEHSPRRGWDDGEIRSPRVPRPDATRQAAAHTPPRRQDPDWARTPRRDTPRRDTLHRSSLHHDPTRREEPTPRGGRTRNTEGRTRQSQTRSRITSSVQANRYDPSALQSPRTQSSRTYGERRRDNRFLHHEQTSQRRNDERR